jgi:hypothetical protein
MSGAACLPFSLPPPAACRPALLCPQSPTRTQPTNKYFIDLLNEEWSVVLNPTGKAQVSGPWIPSSLRRPLSPLRSLTAPCQLLPGFPPPPSPLCSTCASPRVVLRQRRTPSSACLRTMHCGRPTCTGAGRSCTRAMRRPSQQTCSAHTSGPCRCARLAGHERLVAGQPLIAVPLLLLLLPLLLPDQVGAGHTYQLMPEVFAYKGLTGAGALPLCVGVRDPCGSLAGARHPLADSPTHPPPGRPAGSFEGFGTAITPLNNDEDA